MIIYQGEPGQGAGAGLGRGDDAVGNPRRARISQFELFELFLLSKVDKQLSIELEPTLSQSAASPPLKDNDTN